MTAMRRADRICSQEHGGDGRGSDAEAAASRACNVTSLLGAFILFSYLFRSRCTAHPVFLIVRNESVRDRLRSHAVGHPCHRSAQAAREANHVHRLPSPFSHLCFNPSSHTFLTLLPDHDEFVVLSLSPIRRNRRFLLLLCRIPVAQPPPLRLVARTFAQPSPSSFPPFFSSPPSSINTSVAQNICHLSFSRHPRHPYPDSPIPNGTDARWSIRPLIPIPNVPVHLPADSPEIIPRSDQPARICACFVCPLDARPERLEISITRPAFRSGTRNRGRV